MSRSGAPNPHPPTPAPRAQGSAAGSGGYADPPAAPARRRLGSLPSSPGPGPATGADFGRVKGIAVLPEQVKPVVVVVLNGAHAHW
jgi:hypothetical protein